MKSAKSIFASATGLAVIGGLSATAAQGATLIKDAPAAPAPATVSTALSVNAGELKHGGCSAMYMKVVVGTDSRVAPGSGDAIKGFCYFKVSTANIKGSSDASVYFKSPVSSQWGSAQSVNIKSGSELDIKGSYAADQDSFKFK